MQTFFIALFEFCHGGQSNPGFRDYVYGAAGWALLALTLTTVVGYYYGLNWSMARFAGRRYWFRIGVLNAVLNVLTVLLIERAAPDVPVLSPPSLSLAAIAGVYGLIAYGLLSLLVKWGSPNARRTPF